MPFATVNGTSLFWELTGNDGVPLVLVHGSWGDHHVWDAVVPAFSERFRVLTFDRRGHSQSERPKEQGSLGEDASDLAALIDHLELAPAHIVGHSFGGSISLTLAGQRPELFQTLAVHEPPLFGLLQGDPQGDAVMVEQRRSVEAVADRLRSGDMAAGAKLFVNTIAGGNWDQIPEDRQRVFVTNAMTFLDEVQDPNWWWVNLPALYDFPHRTLVTGGEKSPGPFHTVARKIANAIRRAEHRALPGAGHSPARSHPVEFVQVLTTFIAED